MASDLEQNVRFDIIRYANCWEDADVLIKALDISSDGRYLSIASAGDNALSMVSKGAKQVIAVDLNPTQIAATELRAAAFKHLAYEEILAFLGITDMEDRSAVYEGLKESISDESQTYWNAHKDIISKGIIFAGKFERYFKLFRKWILPFVHRRKTVTQLLNDKSLEEQKTFFEKKWNTWRWRLIFKLFFSRFSMGRLGRDPEFFKYVKGNVAARIMDRAAYALTALPTNTNPYLQYILNGHYNGALPHYLRKENCAAIKDNINALEVHKCTVAEALELNNGLKFDGFNLSDIFEYMDIPQYEQELHSIINHSNQGARLVYWNMLADRSRPEAMADFLLSCHTLSDDLFKQDKAFFYKALIIEEIQ